MWVDCIPVVGRMLLATPFSPFISGDTLADLAMFGLDCFGIYPLPISLSAILSL